MAKPLVSTVAVRQMEKEGEKYTMIVYLVSSGKKNHLITEIYRGGRLDSKNGIVYSKDGELVDRQVLPYDPAKILEEESVQF
ncbi:MAG: hypothetical protein KM296_00540 [Brockia lithotrophica]|nr:hypothetical protein [Brockia lithotrophica]